MVISMQNDDLTTRQLLSDGDYPADGEVLAGAATELDTSRPVVRRRS